LDKTGQAAGVKRQQAEILALAERLGLPEPVLFIDNDESALTGRRPAFRRLMGELEAGRVSVLLAFSQDRIGRSPAEWERIIDAARRHRIRMVTCTDGEVDLATVGGRLTSRIRATVAASEVEQKSERQKSGNRHKTLQGKACGTAGWGCRRVRVLDGKGSIKGWYDVVDEDQAKIIRDIAERVLGGESLESCTKWLIATGVPTPSGRGNWKAATLRQQLLHPRLAGLRTYLGEIVADSEAGPIIDRGDWDRLVALLNDPARRTSSDRRAKHLLTGVGRCGVCGSKVNVTRRVDCYSCRRAGCFSVPKVWAEDRVARVVCWSLALPEARHALAADDDDVRGLIAEIDALEARLVEARQAVVAGQLSVASLTAIEAGVAPQVDAARARLRAASSGPDLSDLAGFFDAKRRWDSLPIVRRREIVAALITVRFFPRGKGSTIVSGEHLQIKWQIPALDPANNIQVPDNF